MFVVTRTPSNPLLAPVHTRAWEALAAFNPSPVIRDGITHLFYRAVARPDVLLTPNSGYSTIGYASSRDGYTYAGRRQVVIPQEDWERFGCEDPRPMYFEGKWYVFYTALGGFPYGPDNIKVAVAYGDSPDRLHEKHLVTPFNAKAATLFPERIDGDVVLLLTVHTDWTEEHPRPTIAVARAKNIEEFWDPEFWNRWHETLPEHAIAELRRKDDDHVEIGAAPIKTEHGWLLIYSHIQHYYDESKRLFGIEAVLLDGRLQNIVGRTDFPFLVPEELYERYGMVPDIVFPSGACLSDDTLRIFYGAADTTCASATVYLPHLLSVLMGKPLFTRASEKPILSPIADHAWEAYAVLNPAAIDIDGSVHLLYRAMSHDNTSVLGYARLADGIHVDERLSEPVYTPRESFEEKAEPNGFSGCEDPRLSLVDGILTLCYTAYSGELPRGALSTIAPEDFSAKRFAWSSPTLLTPAGVGDKDVCLFPEKVDDAYLFMHRIDPNICIDTFEELPPEYPADRCIEIMAPRFGMWDERKIGAAGPPLRVPEGWLLIYHGISADGTYRLGAALLDEHGTTVLSRTSAPLLSPELPWEKEGQVNKVVFSCGAVVRDDILFLYYGGGDSHIGVATASLTELRARLAPIIGSFPVPFDLQEQFASAV